MLLAKLCVLQPLRRDFCRELLDPAPQVCRVLLALDQLTQAKLVVPLRLGLRVARLGHLGLQRLDLRLVLGVLLPLHGEDVLLGRGPLVVLLL